MSKFIFQILISILILQFSGCEHENIGQFKSPYTVEEIKTGSNWWLTSIYFEDVNNIIVTGFDISSSDYNSTFLRSSDGGITWSVDTLNLKGLRVDYLTGYKEKRFAKGIDFTVSSNPKNFLLYSKDSGKTWKPDSSFQNCNCSPFFISDSVWLMSWGHIFYKTDDSGANWKQVLSINFPAPGSLIKAGKKNLFIHGGSTYDYVDAGFLFKSTDLGETWAKINHKFSNITNAQFVNDSLGYLFTFKQQMIKTSDTGNSFNIINPNIDPYPICYFNSELEGLYASIVTNSIKYTSDGGKTWYEIYHNNNIQISDMEFYSPQLGIVITHNGLILKIVKH
ncbi:MAG: hypothetical protein JST43_14170 [Bacteroidetes bacterium]|nr:hypothetical protein [Bacteroidota bacterium]MBS1539519.1 hypothetical protein [Bacteroidota bacterium]